MQNLKIRVNSEAEAEEVKRLAVKAGYTLDALFGKKWSDEFCYLVLCGDMSAGFGNEIMADGDKPLSIGELWAMAYPMKEYLVPQNAGGFIYKKAYESKCIPDSWIEIPEGAEAFGYTGIVHTFYKDDFRSFFNENTDGQWDDRGETWIGRKDPVILWQRDQDEPFLTPECTLNDQYTEIEKVRQLEIHGTVKANPDFNFGAAESSGGAKDNVNHPSHYTQGKVECIDALESATIGKSGIKAVCVANVIKYLWRYEEKNGIEDVKKAQFYLNRLLATLEN